MNYRREIDGLRAIAVLPVIFFHAGFKAFSGGFVGVDVFFVLSGYLITSIILSEIQAGSFSLVNFYERRARRILPALFFVMSVSFIFAWLWLFPRDMKEFAKSIVNVCIYLSNRLFNKHTDYFDTASELIPLLHTWSLSVEEQYYIFFPLVLAAIWKRQKKFVSHFLLFLATVSLIYSQLQLHKDSSAAYFLLSSRLWELMIGSIVAYLIFTKRIAVKSNQAGSLVGLLLILYATFFFDKDTSFPGVNALVPTLGAAFVIIFATPKTIVGYLLNSRILVGIGLISYSAYLWHQPIFAFARHKSMAEPTPYLVGGLTLLTLVLAYLTWKYIESPFRNRQLYSRKQIFVSSAAFSLLFILVGLFGIYSNGYENRFSDEQKAILAFEDYDFQSMTRYKECFLSHRQDYTAFKDFCRGNLTHKPIMLWGDSHAAALSFGLKAEYEGLIQYTAGGCPPIKGTVVPGRPKCKSINDYVLQEIKTLQPKIIYMHANWTSYEQSNLGDRIRQTIRSILKASPNTSVILIGSVPQWPRGLPIFMLQRNLTLTSTLYITNSSLNVLRNTDHQLEMTAKDEGVEYLSAIDMLCINDQCPVTTIYENKNLLTAYDYGHLTKGGSLLLAKKIFNLVNYAEM